MSEQNKYAKIKLTLPENPMDLFNGAKAEVEGKELVICEYKIDSGYFRDHVPTLTLRLAPESFEVVCDKTVFDKPLDEANFKELKTDHDYSIPELAMKLDELKRDKAKTIVPKFKKGDVVHRSGYSEYQGAIEEIDISIRDDGEELITYTIAGVGEAWESELELARHPPPVYY